MLAWDDHSNVPELRAKGWTCAYLLADGRTIVEPLRSREEVTAEHGPPRWFYSHPPGVSYRPPPQSGPPMAHQASPATHRPA